MAVTIENIKKSPQRDGSNNGKYKKSLPRYVSNNGKYKKSPPRDGSNNGKYIYIKDRSVCRNT